MRHLFFLLLLFFFINLPAQDLIQPVGLWREHLPYNSTIDIAYNNEKIFCATPYSLFTVERSDNTIERSSKITGLSETGISAIYYDAAIEKLLIAYSNSNMDVIYKNDIINIPDIKRDNIVGDKTIYAIHSRGTNFYLSTGLGVIVVDGEKYEVKDSWFIGNGGGQVKVNGFTNNTDFFYAATEEGLKRTSVNTSNPADYNSWQLMSGVNGLHAGSCQNVLLVNNKILVQKNDSLFVESGNNWNLFYEDGWQIINSNVSEGKIVLCQQKTTGEVRVVIINSNAVVERTLVQSLVISLPRKGIIVQNDPWIADEKGGLSHFTASSFEQYKLNSPRSIASGEMTVYNDIFYATAGEVNDSWIGQQNDNGIYILKEGEWTNINRYVFPQLDSLQDFISIDIDKRDETVWAGSYGGGLLHIKADRSFEIFKQGFIGSAIGDPSSYRVSGLAFDKENNLWISNYGTAQPLRVRKNDGSWINFSVPFSLNENALTQIVVDDNNYKWIVAVKGNGLICYGHGSAIENTGDDHWKIFKQGGGNGNLPGEILCVAKDKNGFIWAGTTNGIGVFQCPQDVFTAQGCEAVWPIVQQGNFAGYLFNGEEVKGIAVDGADRKWVATKNGVWLISATGEKVIYQFTEENSPLLSNDVKKIAINGKTGEVFFATAKGICSFRSTATEGADKNENVLVFPNPVPPNYTGTIAIRGVVNNAIVKITEMHGRLVYQTKALGGQAIWDGKDYKGRKISSGVYLILISDEERKEKKVTKIVFISK